MTDSFRHLNISTYPTKNNHCDNRYEKADPRNFNRPQVHMQIGYYYISERQTNLFISKHKTEKRWFTETEIKEENCVVTNTSSRERMERHFIRFLSISTCQTHYFANFFQWWISYHISLKYEISADITRPDAKPNKMLAVKNAEYVFAKWMIAQPITNGTFMTNSKILWPNLAKTTHFLSWH